MLSKSSRWLVVFLSAWALDSFAAVQTIQAGADDAPAKSTPAKFTPQQLEHFEKQIRPLLIKRCHQCHSAKAKRLEGKLLLDARAGALKGGDTGPALKPGDPKSSLMIQAIQYTGDYKMPPKGKLPAAEIKLLEDWVRNGAPWTIRPPTRNTGPTKDEFDLQRRKSQHWVWQPVKVQPAPRSVRHTDWPRSEIDKYILDKIVDAGLAPAPAAAKHTLLRRVYFDLIGLPPTSEEVDEFVNDKSADTFEKVVDRLLRSPHFGERWGRHWLDLVRYAESRGHEFDYNTPNAFQYRDYVIRALNRDVPYNQFVAEHIAGDLLDQPRQHPDEGFNESIIGTGFWFLGEWVHSPVDIRKDETDRLDNMIDVFSKTFLGMTLACARCHDHKFDAISQRDYYAMAGFLQSSDYRLARFDSLDHNGRISRQLADLRKRARRPVAAAVAESLERGLDDLPQYYLAAREILQLGPDPAAAGAKRAASKEVVFEDFETGTYDNWTATGKAFGLIPQTQKTIGKYQGKVNAAGRFFVNSHNIRVGGDVRKGDSHTGTLTSKKFQITHPFVRFLVGGGAHAGKTCVNLLVDGKVAESSAGKNNNRMELCWWNVSRLIGKQAQIQLVDQHTAGWGNIGLDHIVFTNLGPNKQQPALVVANQYRKRIATTATKLDLDAERVGQWVEHLVNVAKQPADPLHAWAKIAIDKQADNAEHLRGTMQSLVTAWTEQSKSAENALNDAKVVIDFTKPDAGPWIQDGHSFGVGPVRPGDVRLSNDPANPIQNVVTFGAAQRDAAFKGLSLRSGAQNESGKMSGWLRAGQTIRTPTFTVDGGTIYYLVQGPGRAFANVDSHHMINGPLHGAVLYRWNAAKQSAPRWVAQNLSAYKGHRVHIEFSPEGQSDLSVLMVVQAKAMPGMPISIHPARLLASALNQNKIDSVQTVAEALRDLLTEAAQRFGKGEIAESKDASEFAVLAQWLVEHTGLFRSTKKSPDNRIASIARPFIDERQKLVGQIKRSSRLAMAMWDGTSENEQLLIRGNHKTTGGLVPRRSLEAVDGAVQPIFQRITQGSGRLQFARRLTDPAHPLVARVMANRVWHHLFGRGIVASVDNLGVLGERPTHPELLDYLADQFVKGGWSVKGLIRSIVLSRSYQMSSKPNPAAKDIDPSNRLLHRMRIRRLQGEAIRDAILTVSGHLDRTLQGPSIPVHLTAFMQGRGRPGSGPLDGNGRRSVYVSVRRNFLWPMMLAFDMPQPFSSMGRRTVSNVPAQALILMNDPFVVQQARLWAQRVLANKSLDATQRITSIYMTAFGRVPSDSETADALAFVEQQASRYGLDIEKAIDDPRVWADLCHVMFNVKEFIFIN